LKVLKKQSPTGHTAEELTHISPNIYPTLVARTHIYTFFRIVKRNFWNLWFTPQVVKHSITKPIIKSIFTVHTLETTRTFFPWHKIKKVKLKWSVMKKLRGNYIFLLWTIGLSHFAPTNYHFDKKIASNYHLYKLWPFLSV